MNSVKEGRVRTAGIPCQEIADGNRIARPFDRSAILIGKGFQDQENANLTPPV